MEAVELPAVLKLMQAEEKARENAAMMAKMKAPMLHMARSRGSGAPGRQQRVTPWTSPEAACDQCSGCGRVGHRFKDDQCPAVNVDCRSCGAIGHFQRYCRSRRGRGGGPFHGTQQQNLSSTRTVQEDEVSEEALLRVASMGNKRPLHRVEISNGQRFNWLEVEFDSGADPTTITVEQYETYCPHLPLMKPKTKLVNFDGSQIKGIHGVIETKIRANGKVHRGKVHVVDSAYPTVLGKEFLQHLAVSIDCTQLRNVSQKKTDKKTQDSLKQMCVYTKLLKPGVGQFPDSKHKIRLSNVGVPFAARTCPIPLTRRDKAKAETELMEHESVWEGTSTPAKKGENTAAEAISRPVDAAQEEGIAMTNVKKTTCDVRKKIGSNVTRAIDVATIRDEIYAKTENFVNLSHVRAAYQIHPEEGGEGGKWKKPERAKTTSSPVQASGIAKPLRSRYRVGDLVLVKLPFVLNEASPYATSKRVTKVLGSWAGEVGGGRVWNGRKLRRYLPPATELLSDPHMDNADTETTTVADEERQDRPQRATRGVAPERYSPTIPIRSWRRR